MSSRRSCHPNGWSYGRTVSRPPMTRLRDPAHCARGSGSTGRAARPLCRPGRARQGARAPGRGRSPPSRRSARDRRPRRRPRCAAELLALRDSLGAGGRVHLLGAVESPLDLYGDADVLALPPRMRTSAWSLPRPQPQGQRRSQRPLRRRRGRARSRRARRPYGEVPLQEALARLLGDEGLRAELGRGGREVAREFSWPNIARLQAEIYERVV